MCALQGCPGERPRQARRRSTPAQSSRCKPVSRRKIAKTGKTRDVTARCDALRSTELSAANCRMLQAQLKMATEKAHMDVVMQRGESERKIALLVDKLRAQRMSLEVAKECLAEMNMEVAEVREICEDLSQSLGDTGGEASSRGSRRSAAGTVENGDAECNKLQTACMRIRKLEAELTISQGRSERIAGLENEMEMYTSMQDSKIQEMQGQIRELHVKLQEERQRNEELASTFPSIDIEGGDLKSACRSLIMPAQSSEPLPGHNLDVTINYQIVDSVRTATSDERELETASPARPNAESNLTRGYSPYNPIENQIESRGDLDGNETTQRGYVGRRSVSDLASKFEHRSPSAVGFACSANLPALSNHSSAHVEREITNSPRPRILQSAAKAGGPSTPKPLIQKALNLYDSIGKQQTTGRKNPADAHNGRVQSSPVQPLGGRTTPLDSSQGEILIRMVVDWFVSLC